MTTKTYNEYRKSLEFYHEMSRRFDDLVNLGRNVPEEELIVFLQDLNNYWPIMFSIEQRQKFREFFLSTVKTIDRLYRRPNKRDSCLGCFGLYGGFATGFLDEKVHQGKPVLILNEVEGMANAIDKLEDKILS